MKKALSMLLVLVMLLGMMPQQVFATEGTQENEAVEVVEAPEEETTYGANTIEYISTTERTYINFSMKNADPDSATPTYCIDKYRVTPGHKVLIHARIGEAAYCAWVNADGNRTKALQGNSAPGINVSRVLTVPSGAVYLEVSYSITYEHYIGEPDAGKIHGAQIGLLGDSIASNGGFLNTVLNKLCLSSGKNVAVGGWFYSEDTGVNGEYPSDATHGIYRQIQNLTGDENLIVLWGGTNDFGHSHKIGTMFDEQEQLNLDVTTFYGGMNRAIADLHNKFGKDVPIVICTPLHRNMPNQGAVGYPYSSRSANKLGYYLSDYIEAMLVVADYYDLLVFDSDTETKLNPNDEGINSKYFSDGLHPNAAGHAIIGNKLAQFIVKKLSDQLGYSYKTIVTAPTCTEQGYTTYTCECGDSYTADFTEATGNHTFIGKTCSHCGAENPYKHYHWEIQNGELVSMHTVNQQATANAPHWMTGTITADGTMDKTQYELETAVKLEHDQPWIIEWMVLENSAWSGMLLSETATCTVTTEKYVFYNGRGRLVIGAPNVGRDIAVDTSKAHVYRLENTIVGNGNTVSLYVDGECMGVMGQGTGSMLQQNDWLNNGSTDMILKYIGAKHSSHTDFLLNNLKLGYLKIWEGGCVHSYTTTVVAPTCMQDGYTLHTCSGCGHTYKTDLVSKTDHISQSVTVVAPTCMREGYTLHLCGTCGEHYQTDPLPPVDHDFAEGNKTCITCGANNPVNPDNPASANWPVLNTDLTHIICYGQSLSVGSDAPYYADAAVDGVYMYGNLNSGTTDTTLSPLRGSTQDPIISAVKALMKMLQQDSVNQIDTDIVVGSYGMGSQTIAQLMSTDRQAQIKAEMGYTENCNNSGRYAVFANSVDALARYADRNSQTISCPAIVFLQGESDYLTQRSYSVEADKDLYKTYMKRLKEDMQQKVMAAYGQTTAPLFLIYQVSGTYVHTEDMGINMAQLEFAQENDDVILVQTPYFTSHYTTGNHLTQNGYRWLGEYIAKYMYTTLIKREQIAPPQADTITLTAENTITIHVSGVEGGLEIDTYTVEDATNGSNKYGFTVYADGVKYVPTNVTVSGSAITLECDAANGVFRKATSLSVAYAGLDAIGTGNIRDNCTDSGLYQYLDDRNDRAVSGNNSISHSSKDASGASIIGQNYPLYNWLASFRSQVTVPACEHSYTDGKCSVCGGLDAYVEFYSLSLKGNIAVNYYMYLDEAVAADPDGYMEFTTPRDGAVQIPVSQANVQTVDGQKYYVFTATVAAKEMMDTIQGQYICGESKSEIFYYSVKEYAEIILNDEAYAKVQPLVEAMLVYGAWAQKQFGYNTDNLPVETENLEGITAETLANFAPAVTPNELNVKFIGSSLILETETTMRLYFQGTSQPTVSLGGNALAVTSQTMEGATVYYVDVKNIAAKNLSDSFILEVSDGTTTAEIAYCPLSYCYNVLDGSMDEKFDDAEALAVLKNTVRALYLYNQAANNYFK